VLAEYSFFSFSSAASDCFVVFYRGEKCTVLEDNKCHYYAQIKASLLCSIIHVINIKIDKRPQKTGLCSLDYKCKWKQSEEAADNVVELELLEAMFLLICNQTWSKNVVPGLVSCVGIPWFWGSFHKAQRVKETLHYYSSIMLNSFASLPH